MLLIITLSKEVETKDEALNLISFVKDQLDQHPNVKLNASVTTELWPYDDHD